MRTFIGVVAAIGVIAISACNRPIVPTDSTVYALKGQVTDAILHKPVTNITVGVVTDSGALSAVSDAQGRYIFPGINGVRPNPYVTVYVHDPSYQLYSTVVNLERNEIITLDIVLAPQ